MDSITQAALGAVVGEVGFRHKLGNKAVLFGALYGLLPDADVILGAFDEWAVMAWHRGVTHSLVVLPFVAPLVAWISYRIDKRRTPYRTWVHLAFWALITHPLLDWCTSYGTVLLAPLSDHRFSLDAVAILDPFYTVPLLIALIVGRVKRVPVPAVRWVGGIALVLTTGYLALGVLQARRGVELARAQFESAEQEARFEPVDIRATPTFFNVWVRRILARDADGNLRIGYVSTWSPAEIEFMERNRPRDAEDAELVADIIGRREGKLFQWFSMGMLSFQIDRSPDLKPGGVETVMTVFDHRFGLLTRPMEPPFRVVAEYKADGVFHSVRRVRHHGKIDAGREVAALWSFMWKGRME